MPAMLADAAAQTTRATLSRLPAAQCDRALRCIGGLLDSDPLAVQVERLPNGIASVRTRTRTYGTVTTYVRPDGAVASRSY